MQEPRSVEEILRTHSRYPAEAFAFVQRGLAWTVEQLGRSDRPEGERHVSGQELSLGLRDFALHEWGLLARTVLSNWNITGSEDFGRIVFYLIYNMLMQKTDEDSMDDFRDVFRFDDTFAAAYRIDLSELEE
jgi:uncharacterized repeat protein (TIGR04138 family)